MKIPMEDRQTIWDPLRRKEVALTPEERVRQWCIGILSGPMEVPLHMMMSEASFKLGDKKYRADILVYDRQARPVAVVECKRPEVPLDADVLDQAIRYNMVLEVRYLIITNGARACIFRREEHEDGIRYVRTSEAPTYKDMI